MTCVIDIGDGGQIEFPGPRVILWLDEYHCTVQVLCVLGLHFPATNLLLSEPCDCEPRPFPWAPEATHVITHE